MAATHTLPSVAWALLAPLQLVPGVRRRFPTAHRWAGRLFMVPVALMTVGYVLIERNGLLTSSDSPGETWWMRACLAYWVWAAGAGWVAARQRRYAAHGRWMLRHVAMGFSVAVMRLMLVALVMGVRTRDEDLKRRIFGGTAIAANGLCTLACEVMLWRRGRAAKAPLIAADKTL